MSWALLESGQPSAGLIVDPSITERKCDSTPSWMATGTHSDQWKNFLKQKVCALAMDGVQGEFAMDEAKLFVDQAGGEPYDVEVWSVLLDHQKLAARIGTPERSWVVS